MSDLVVPVIADRLGMTVDALSREARLAHVNGYTSFELFLRGKRRAISAPRERLKRLQRRLHQLILVDVPQSPHVHSRRGRDVVSHANQHLSQRYMAVEDIRDCFPSTTLGLVRNAFVQLGSDPLTAGLLTKLVTYHGSLPQGAPTSPAVLNLVFAPIDSALARLSSEAGAVYTRYMDDLCFSSDHPLQRFSKAVAAVLRSHGYIVNKRKRRLWGPHDQHTVTKIVVTSTLNPTDEYLRNLTRELSQLSNHRSVLSRSELIGKISWVKRLNPNLGGELEQHHSRALFGH